MMFTTQQDPKQKHPLEILKNAVFPGEKLLLFRALYLKNFEDDLLHVYFSDTLSQHSEA